MVYDGICRAFGQRRNGDLIVGVLVLVYVVVATFIACHLFAGRAAFLLTGAMLATAMSANVLMVIIPGQRKTVAAMKAGRSPIRRIRCAPNSAAFTTPISRCRFCFAMLSNHYSMTWQCAEQLAGAGAHHAGWRPYSSVLRAQAQGQA